MGIGHGDELTAVGWVGEDFLIAGHTRIKTNFANGFTFCTKGNPGKYSPVF
jgi:hypothetical protein